MVKEESKNKAKKYNSLIEDIALLESYVQEIFKFIPLPLFFSNLKGVILEANPALEKITGRDIYSLIGEPIENIFDGKEIKKIIRETIQKGFVHDKETFVVDKDFKKVPVSVFTQVRKSLKGVKTGIFFSLINLTEIKKKEESIQKSSKILEVKVAAKTRELQKITDELEVNIKKRTKELEEKVEELEKMNKLMVGRELKMVGLKEKINEYEKEVNKLKEES